MVKVTLREAKKSKTERKKERKKCSSVRCAEVDDEKSHETERKKERSSAVRRGEVGDERGFCCCRRSSDGVNRRLV